VKISQKIREQIEAQLASGEHLRALELGQIKNNMGRQAAQTVALAAIKAALTGGGSRRGSFALVWVAVTDKRLLLCRTDRYHQTVGEAMSLPLPDITVNSSGTLLRTLEVSKASKSIIQINFGLRKGALESVQNALTQHSASS